MIQIREMQVRDTNAVAEIEQQEYFSMKLLSLIHEVCEGEQFEEISAPDFYANMNLQRETYHYRI